MGVDIPVTESGIIVEPGVYRDLGRIQYERIDAVNYSLLKHFARSPAHARQEMLCPKKPTDAMELGTAMHMAILEPERFAREYVRAPQCDRRTKDGKALWAAFEAEHLGRNYLTDDEWIRCDGMTHAVQQHELARTLIYGPGRNEVSIVWRNRDTGLLCKGRLDRFTKFMGWSVVIDVKSAANASDAMFPAAAARLGYHVQVAFYLDGLEAIAPTRRRFLIAAVESDAPHCVAVYELDDDALAEGRRQYQRYLGTYAECKQTGIWPGYPEGIYPLRLPRWAMTPGQDEAA